MLSLFIQPYIARVGSGSGESCPDPAKKVRRRIRIRNQEYKSINLQEANRRVRAASGGSNASDFQMMLRSYGKSAGRHQPSTLFLNYEM